MGRTFPTDAATSALLENLHRTTGKVRPFPASSTGSQHCSMPAVVLLVARVVLHERVAERLRRVERWMTAHSREALAWVLFLLGLYLVGDAVQALQLG